MKRALSVKDLSLLVADRHYYLRMAHISLKNTSLSGDFDAFCNLAEQVQLEIDKIQPFSQERN